MKRQKTFFDEDITINLKLFDNFKINDIASWSHLELWCTIQNIEVDYDFFKGILCGTVVIENLFEIVLDAIKNTNFLDKFLNNIEVIKILEKIYDCSEVCRTFKAKEFWIDIAFKQGYDSVYEEYWDSETLKDNDKKYKLLNAIFNKNPFIILKFYDKHKIVLHLHDIKFERWLLMKCEKLSKISTNFAKIYTVLNTEIKKQNNISMYLN